MPRHGFTLIELLVVVAIIAVLLALLMPALDKAIYQAELTVCAANLKGIGTSVTIYAMDNRRVYPKGGARTSQPANLVGGGPDWRPTLRRAFDLNKFLNCPLNSFVDFETKPTVSQGVWADYNLYFGWGFDGEKTMSRLGDVWTDSGEPFQVVACDRDLVMPQRQNGAGELQSSHPDRSQAMDLYTIQDSAGLWGQVVCTISLWQKFKAYKRSEIDQNFALQEGAVLSIRDVTYDDDRLTKVHTWADNHEFPGAYSQMPR